MCALLAGALSISGDARAGARLRAAWAAQVPAATAIALSGNIVAIAAGRHVIGHDRARGAELFRVDVGGAVRTLSADDRSIVAVVEGRGIAVVDPARGAIRFRRGRSGSYTFAIAAGADLVLTRREGIVELRRSADGRLAWRRALTARPGAPPAAAGPHVFSVDDVFVHALRRSDGRRRWRFAVRGAGTPLPAGESVVLAAPRAGFVSALSARDGAFRWTYRLDRRAVVPPVSGGGRLLLAAAAPGAGEEGRTLIRAIDGKSGMLAWALAVPGEVTALAAADDLAFAAVGATVHVLSLRRGLHLMTADAGARVLALARAPGLLVTLAEGGRVAAFPLPADPESLPAAADLSLRRVAPTGLSRTALEELAVRFARREIEAASGEAVGPSGVLVVSRRAAHDPILGRPVLVVEMLAEDSYLCRAKVAADGLEVLSWSNEAASVRSEYVDVSASQAELLTRGKAPLPEGAVLTHARVEIDSEGKAYLDVRWSTAGASSPQLEMRLHPRTGALISLAALWRVPEARLKAWLRDLLAYRSPEARAPGAQGEHPTRPLPGEIRHHRLASKAYDAAWDGTSIWVTTNGGLYKVDPTTGAHERLTMRDGLLDNELMAVAARPGGPVWVASARGLSRVAPGRVDRFPFELPELRGRELTVRQLGLGAYEVWAATTAGAIRWRAGGYTWYGQPHGLLSENVRSVAVAPKGGVWLATEEGVARFDGSRWRMLRESDGLPQNDTVAVILDRKGRLWVATADNGVARRDGRKWTIFRKQTGYGIPPERGPASDRIRDFALDTPGGVWGVYAGGLTRYFGGKWLHIPIGGAVRGRELSRVVLGNRRMICVARGPGQGLAAFNGRAWIPEFVPPDRNEPPAAEWVVASGDSVYAGARAFGVAQYRGGKWTRHTIDTGPLGGVLRATDSAVPDGQGGVWVGARGAICRHEAQKWTCSAEGVGSQSVVSVSRGPKGALWAAMSGGGIARLDAGRWTRYGESEGLPGTDARQVLAAADGGVFVLTGPAGGRTSLLYLAPGQSVFRPLGPEAGVAAAPTALAIDRAARVWVATAAATLLRWDGGRFVHEVRYDGLPAAPISRLAFDSRDHPWAIHDRGRGVRHHDGTSWIAFTRANGLISDRARDLTVDARGAVWIATEEGLTEYLPKE